MTLRFLLCLVICLPRIVIAQTFTDVTPGNIPAVESGDIAWADYNNDGYLDFAIMGMVSSSVYVGAIYTGAGDGTFSLLANNTMPKMRSGDLDWGDFDNDGDLDLAMIGEADVSPYEITVIMRNNITSFERHFTASGSEGASLLWLDYDNDEDLDLYQVGAFFDNFYPNSVFINTDGQFSTAESFHVKGYSSDLAIDATSCVATDFDLDGDPDIFSSGKYSHGTWNVASLLVNNGVKNIENTSTYRFSYNDLAIRSGSINQADFNKDGLTDYFLTGNSSSISGQSTPFSQLLLGTGDGNFHRRGGLLNVYSSSSDVGDIDNDGDLDIILSGVASGGVLTRIFLNNGSGNFSDAGITNLVGLSLCAVTLADYDNDGDLDILMTGRNSSNGKTTKLYRNNLLEGSSAPNEKPVPPSNLRYTIENNTVKLEWDGANDTETPAASLTYNAYVAIAASKPFKLFPHADAETGKRKVHDHGNTSVSTHRTLKDLKTGTYYFSVQSIDGVNAGSEFATEVSFKYIRIDPIGSTCVGSEQEFSVSPPDAYAWSITGGKILEGQGTGNLRVKWDKQPANAKITVSLNGASNTFVPVVNQLPPAVISGPEKICDLNEFTEYRPLDNYSENVTYSWNVDGVESSNFLRYVDWVLPGTSIVTLRTTNKTTGCTNADTLNVKVSQRIDVEIFENEGEYTWANISPGYSYQWDKVDGNTLTTVGTGESFEPVAIGTYRLTITNESGCSYYTNFYVDVITSLEDELRNLRLSPNPATSTFKILEVPQTGKPARISVFDMTGRAMIITATTDKTIEINCSTLPRGMYAVLIQTGEETRYSKLLLE